MLCKKMQIGEKRWLTLICNAGYKLINKAEQPYYIYIEDTKMDEFTVVGCMVVYVCVIVALLMVGLIAPAVFFWSLIPAAAIILYLV